MPEFNLSKQDLARGMEHILKAGDYSRQLGDIWEEYWSRSGEKTTEDLQRERERLRAQLNKPAYMKTGIGRPYVTAARNERLRGQIATLDDAIRHREHGVTLPELRDSLFQAEMSNPSFWEMERSFHEERIASYYPDWMGLAPQDREQRYDKLREKYAPLRITNPIVGTLDNLVFQRGMGGWGNPLDMMAATYAGGAASSAFWLESAGGMMKFMKEDIGAVAPDDLPEPIRKVVDQVAQITGATPLQVMDDMERYIGAASEHYRAEQQKWSRPGFIPQLTQALVEAGGFILTVKGAAGMGAGWTALPLVAGVHGRNTSREAAVVEGLKAGALLPFFRYLVGPTDAVRMAKGFGFGSAVAIGEDALARLEDKIRVGIGIGMGKPEVMLRGMSPESRWFQYATGDDLMLSSATWAWLGKLPHGDPVRARFTPQQERWQDYQRKALDVESALERLEQPDLSRGQRGRAVASVEKELAALREQAEGLQLPFPTETTEAFVQRLKDANGVVRRAATDGVGMREAFRRELHEAVERGEAERLDPDFLDNALMPLMDRLAYRYAKNHPELPTDAGYATLGFRYSENPADVPATAQEARRTAEQRVRKTERRRAKKKPAAPKERRPGFELQPDPAEKRHDWFVTEGREHPAAEGNARRYLARTPSEGGPAPVDLQVATSTRAEQDIMDRQRDGAWKPAAAAGQTTRRALPARGRPRPYYPDYREGAMRPLSVQELEGMIEPLPEGGYRVKGRGHVITPDGRLILELPDGKHIVASGPATFEDLLKMSEEQLTPREILRSATWYERLRNMFVGRFGPDLGPRMNRAHLALQANTGPDAAWAQLMKFAKQAILGEAVEKPGLGLGGEAAQEFIELGYVGSWTKGLGKKIWSFLDSGEGKERSTIYGNDVRIGGPFVGDVWMARAFGFSDPTMLRGRINTLRGRFAGDEITQRLLDAVPAEISAELGRENAPSYLKSGMLSDVQYDYVHRKGNALTEHANRISWMGKNNWRPEEIQAVVWTAIRRAHGWPDADPADIFSRSDSSFEKALRQRWEKQKSSPAERVRDTSHVLSFVSPNVLENVPWRDALKGVGDPYHRLGIAAFTESHNAIYPDANKRPGLRTHGNVLGYWESTGEPAAVKEHLAGTRWEDLRVEAALDGYAGRQKAVAIFERGVDPEPGTNQLAARVWEIVMPKGLSVDRIVGALTRRGFPGYSLEVEPNKETARRVWLIDPGNENAPRVQALMKELGARGNWMDGRAEFLEGKTRQEAGKAFEGIIRGSGRKDLLEDIVLPVNDGRGRKGNELSRLAAEADRLLKDAAKPVEKPIPSFLGPRRSTASEIEAIERQFGVRVRRPHQIPVTPALARGNRRKGYTDIIVGDNEYTTHTAVARLAGFASLPKSGMVRGYIDKETGEFIDTAQAKTKYGKEESTEFFLTGEPLTGVARFRQEVPEPQRVEGELRGETQIPIGRPVSPEMQALMRFTRTADPVTAVHEMSHYAIEGMMTPAERRRMYAALGAKDVDRVPDLIRERAAKQAEKYFRDGRAPSAELQPMFDRLAEAMRTWWIHSRDYWSGVGELKPEVRRALDQLLLPDTHSVAEARELSEATGYDAAHRHRKDMPGTMADAARAFQAAQEPPDPAGMVWRKNPTTGKRERVKWTDNINLDKIRGPDDWRAIMLATGQEVGPASHKRTKKISWGETRARADEIGLTPEEIKLGVSQERGAWVWDSATIDRARDISVMLQGEITTLARRMKPKAINGTLTDQEKAHFIDRLYQWRMFQDTLQAQVSEIARSLNIMRRVKDVSIGFDLPLEKGGAEAEQMAGMRSDQIRAFEKQRQYTDVTGAFDWAKFASALEHPNPRTLNQVTRPTVIRALEEIWTANLLTGFRTQARNIGSNTAFNLWRIPEMQVAGLIGEGRYLAGKVARIPVKDRVKITDALAYTYGAVRSGEAIMTAMGRLLADDPMINRLTEAGVFGSYHTPETLRRAREAPLPEGIEDLVFEQKVKPEYRSAFGAQAFGLQGTGAGKALDVYGEAARLASFTMLQLGDVPFKVIGFNEALTRLAFHKAAEEVGGQHKMLSTPAFWERVAYHESHPTRKMIEAAQENARYQTFTSETMGPLAKGLALASRQIPLVGKQVLPFVQIGSNLFAAGFERSPIAPIMTPKRFWGTVYGKPEGKAKRQLFPKGGAAFDEQMAKWLMGTAVSSFFAYQAAQGNFTGAGPPDYVDNMAWRQVYQPYSFRWTNPMTGKQEWVSYRDLDPLAYVLGIGADVGASEEGRKALRAVSDMMGVISDFTDLSPYLDPDETPDPVAKIIQAISDLATSRTYWMTAARVTEAISGKREHQIRQATGTMVRSWVPRYLQQFRYNEDPYRRETRTSDENALLRQARTALNELRNTVASKSRNLPPKRDVWGARDRVGGVAGPDLVSFVYSQEMQSDPVRREQVRLGLSFAQIPWKKEAVRLGPWQRDHWARTAGRAAHTQMTQLVTDQATANPRKHWKGGRDAQLRWSQMNDDERKAVMKGTVLEARRMAFNPVIWAQGPLKLHVPGVGLLPHMPEEKRRQILRRRARP